MGLLTNGKPLTWESAKNFCEHVKNNGIEQFISMYHKVKDQESNFLKWGDEVEYILIKLDEKNKTAKLLLKSSEYLEILNSEEKNISSFETIDSVWRPEYARYMIEGTPARPFGHSIFDLLDIEPNMNKRREKIKSMLKENEYLITMTNFPRLGQKNCSFPSFNPKGDVADSLYIPDEFINEHPRFSTLTKNIRLRRKSKVNIQVPIYLDEKIRIPFRESIEIQEEAFHIKENHIYMDAMCFGMGCCCLQVTIQTFKIDEARCLYDQLAVLSPIFLALSAASPIYKGYLSDIDCRWNVIAQSVDDRTLEEMGSMPLKENKFVINKSRYDSIDSFLTLSPSSSQYNDLNCVIDKDIYEKLINSGIDHLLAQHIAHIFIRDPLVIYEETLNQDNETQNDHFENIQSTNWQTVRFKPPPPQTNIGWRIEFRPMEIQFSDFENAAYSVFIVLLTRVILSFHLNLLVPITKIDENIKKAQTRDSVLNETFYFRKTLFSKNQEFNKNVNELGTLMSINAIINGDNQFIGLIPLINHYLNNINLNLESHEIIEKYLNLISRRASGSLMTTAAYIRKFVQEHPNYQKDSVVTEEINFDLIKRVIQIEEGQVIPELVG